MGSAGGHYNRSYISQRNRLLRLFSGIDRERLPQLTPVLLAVRDFCFLFSSPVVRLRTFFFVFFSCCPSVMPCPVAGSALPANQNCCRQATGTALVASMAMTADVEPSCDRAKKSPPTLPRLPPLQTRGFRVAEGAWEGRNRRSQSRCRS